MSYCPAAPFEPLRLHGESVTVETDGKILVLPTGNADILPRFNEYTLNSNRLTVAESPFGGLKGSGSPDFAPGTLYTPTDGIYLTDTSGTNSTKTLTAGKLKELGLLTVDTVQHCITEEFIVANTATSNNPTVVDSCDSATGWDFLFGTGTISVENGRLKAVGTTDASGFLLIYKNVTLNLSNYQFLTLEMEANVSCTARNRLTSGATYKIWDSASRFSLPANTKTRYVYPINAPQGTTGQNPNIVSGSFNTANITVLLFGITSTPNAAVTFYIDSITADVAKSTYVELQTPNNLADTSIQLYTHNGTAYQLCRVSNLDYTWSDVSTTPANCTLADGSKLDDVYGSTNGRAVFPKGLAGEIKAGSSGSITYSQNKGSRNRIGFRVDLPPSDGGRTNFSKIRVKTVLYYTTDSAGKRSATFDFDNSTSASYGLQNLSKHWIAIYNPTDNYLDFFLHTNRPKKLSYKRDESGTIYEFDLYPGNGLLYHGRITHCNLILDTNSDLIPNCIRNDLGHFVTQDGQNFTTADGNYFDVQGNEDHESIYNFLKGYGMVI